MKKNLPTIQDLNRYNKEMRRKNMFFMQFNNLEEYIDYLSGRIPSKKKVNSPKISNTISSYKRNFSDNINSLDSRIGSTPKKESPKYSGDYIVGIATMHKSNLVPVGREDSPIHYSTMRRS